MFDFLAIIPLGGTFHKIRGTQVWKSMMTAW
jgi:hypothetical protein